jgi:hypothetical protein
VPELAGGGLGRADQGGADSLSPEWSEDLQVVESGHTGKLPADLGLVGWLALQEHLAGRAAVEPGHQQDSATALLARQAVGEPMALSQDRHQRGKVGVGRRADLGIRSHEVQPSDPVEPVYMIPHERRLRRRRPRPGRRAARASSQLDRCSGAARERSMLASCPFSLNLL